jgi:serine/threonine protein kinase/Tfp pilus assembly protein PilF
MPIEPGQQLLHYRLIGKIGEGGMGVVWKAEDTRLRRQVALKFIPENRSQDAQAVDRHLREARAASSLNHPNICSIYDIGEWEGRRFIVMELLEGRTLQEHVGGKQMEVEAAVDFATQIAGALAAAHAKGIIHRDIKTANMFVVGDGQDGLRAKMLDFGLAKLVADPGPGPGSDDPTRSAMHVTTPGAVVGTVSYMSPEQALGKELDARTDIFSLGVVLYEMITARRAFGGDTSAAVFDAILNRAPTAPVQLNAAVPAELERIINKALEKDPGLRYQSAADLCSDLKRLRRDSSGDRSAATPTPVTAGSRQRWLRGLGAVGLVLVAVLAINMMRTRPDSGSPTAADQAESLSRGPSIAVMPFSNASGDPDQEYFSIGLTEDIITELARFRELTVIAHNSTKGFRGEDIDVREVGASLGSRYLLQGSVRRAGQQIRISVQLSDTRDGQLVWGTNYERDLTVLSLFELQDELVLRVVNEIAGTYGAMNRAELSGARRKAPASLDSYDCVLRAYEYLQYHRAEKHLAARDCLERVVKADPDYAEARAWLGYLYADEFHHRWNERADEYNALDRALKHCEAAVQLDIANPVTHGALSLVLMFRGDHERGKSEAYRAIELSPNDSLWLSLLGTYLCQLEDFEHGVPMIERAIAINPYPQGWIKMGLFYDEYHHGRYERALEVAKELELALDFRGPMFLAAAYGQLGRREDAAPALDDLREWWGRPVGELRQELVERHAVVPAVTDHLMEGLEKAGLEGAVSSPVLDGATDSVLSGTKENH